jgi:hypothetical protein
LLKRLKLFTDLDLALAKARAVTNNCARTFMHGGLADGEVTLTREAAFARLLLSTFILVSASSPYASFHKGAWPPSLVCACVERPMLVARIGFS